MKVIVDNATGKVLYSSNIDVDVLETESVIEVDNLDFVNPYYNFQTGVFFESLDMEQIAVPVPSEVPLWKIRAILKIAELEEQIGIAISGLEEPIRSAADSIWNFGTSVERNSQTVSLIQAVLQMTNEQVDQIFIDANNIQL